MKTFHNFMNHCTAETILEEMPEKQKKRYLPYMEETLDTLREEKVLTPAAVCEKKPVTRVTADTIWINFIPLMNTVLPSIARMGTPAYPFIVTAGHQLDSYLQNSDDDLLKYFGNMLMQCCLEEGILAITKEILADNASQGITRERFSLVIPGITGKCEANQLPNVLKMIPDGVTETGIHVREDGLIFPLYSIVGVLYADDGQRNLPENGPDSVTERQFIRTLEKISGHM